MENIVLDQTSDQPDQDLSAIVGEIAAEGLQKQSFHRLSYEAYSAVNGSDKLRSLVSDWGVVAGSIPSTADAGAILGYFQMILGDLEAAQATLESSSGSEWGSYWLCRVLLEKKMPGEALAIAKKFQGGSPASVDFAYLAVEALLQSGDIDEARSILDSLKTGQSESSQFAYASGLCSEKDGDYREAIDFYHRATSLDEENYDAYFRLGYLLGFHATEEEEQSGLALEYYEKCLQARPINTNVVMNLGILYEDCERYHDAIQCFQAVLKHHPNHTREKLFLDDAVASTTMFYDKEQEKKADRQSQVLRIPVSDFELSVRSRNCLHKMNIDTLGDLIMRTEQELLSYKNFGETSLTEIKEMLVQKKLRLGQGLDELDSEPLSPRNPLEASADPQVLDTPIDSLNLSVRSRRCMERLNVRLVRDLINKTEVELMSAKNFGMTSLTEIKQQLNEKGLSLRG